MIAKRFPVPVGEELSMDVYARSIMISFVHEIAIVLRKYLDSEAVADWMNKTHTTQPQRATLTRWVSNQEIR